MNKLLKGNITITRASDGHGLIRIIVRDDSSRREFLEVTLDLEQFAFAITGLSHTPCTFEVSDLDSIGKSRILEQRTATCPTRNLDDNFYKEYLLDNFQETG